MMESDPFNLGYHSRDALEAAGFAALGKNVLISRTATLIGLKHMWIGDHVRIDGYTTISAGMTGIRIGRNVHIGSYTALGGGAGIVLEDFSGLSQGVKIFTKSDDYSGMGLTNPTVPSEFTAVRSGAVRISRHVILGAGAVVLPGVTIAEGAAIGALSLITCDLESWMIYAGVPVRALKPRQRNLLAQELSYLARDELKG